MVAAIHQLLLIFPTTGRSILIPWPGEIISASFVQSVGRCVSIILQTSLSHLISGNKGLLLTVWYYRLSQLFVLLTRVHLSRAILLTGYCK